MTQCIFTLTDNKLTTVSGADAGTYPVTDNKAEILISGVTSVVNPFENATVADNKITVEI